MTAFLAYANAYVPYVLGLILVAFLIFIGLLLLNLKKIPPLAAEEKYYFGAAPEGLTQRATQRLSQALTIDTSKGEMKAFHDFLEKAYPNVHLHMKKEVISGGSLLFSYPTKNKKKALIFCAHMDTVPADGKWKYPPLSGKVADGKIWGRGAIDCKNVVIALMETMEHLFEAGLNPTRDIYLAFGHDEEIGGANGAKEIAKRLKSRGIQAELVLDEGAHIAKGFMGKRNCTVAPVSICEKGYMDIKITAQTGGGHSSAPPKHSGLGLVAEAICRIEASPMAPQLTSLAEEYLLRIAPVMDTKSRFYIANRHLLKKGFFKHFSKNAKLNALLRNTLAVTMASGASVPNILPSSAHATINVRLLPNVKGEVVLQHIEAIVKPLGLTAEIIRIDESVSDYTYKGSMFMELEQSIKERFGHEVIVAPGLMLGATDSKYYEGISENTFRFMPVVLKEGQAAKMHAADEAIPVASLGAAVDFYMSFIKKLCK